MEAKIYNKSGWIENTEPTQLKETFENLLISSGFGVLKFMEHHFDPFGWTGIWLLSESHLALHTFPEENKTYYELSSCIESYYDTFIESFNNIF